MTRHLDRSVLVAGAVLLALLLVWQFVAIVRARAQVAAAMQQRNRFLDAINANEIPPPPRDPSLQSGRVFNAWEKLPLVSRPLSASDFPPSGGKER